MAKLNRYELVCAGETLIIEADGFTAEPNEIAFYINQNGGVKELIHYLSLSGPFSVKKL